MLVYGLETNFLELLQRILNLIFNNFILRGTYKRSCQSVQVTTLILVRVLVKDRVRWVLCVKAALTQKAFFLHKICTVNTYGAGRDCPDFADQLLVINAVDSLVV